MTDQPDSWIESTAESFCQMLRHRVAQGRDWVANWEPRTRPKDWA